MKKIYTLLVVVFCFVGAFAQEQITNFNNKMTQSPNAVTYLGTINNRIIFSAFTPETKNSVWTTDGTPKNTVELTDQNETKIAATNNIFKLGNALFLQEGKTLWQTTDGVTVTKIFESQSLQNVVKLEKELILVEYSSSYQPYNLTVLDSLGNRKRIASNTFGYVIRNGNLLFINTLNEVVFYKNGILKIISLRDESENFQFSDPISSEIVGTDTYFFLQGATKRKIISITKDNEVIILDKEKISSGVPIQPIIYDENKQPYLTELSNDSLKLIQLLPERVFLEKYTIFTRNRLGTPFFAANNAMQLYKNELFYFTYRCGEGGCNNYLHVIDIKTNRHKVSTSLIPHLYPYYPANWIDVLSLDSNRYVLNKQYIYDFSANKITDTLQQTTPIIPTKQDSVFTINGQKLLFTQNNIFTAEKIPLLAARKIAVHGGLPPQTLVHENKLYIWKTENAYTDSSKVQLFVSNGERGGTTLLKEIDGTISSIEKTNNNVYFVITTLSTPTEWYIYETNGTTESTKKLLELTENPASSLILQSANDTQLLYGYTFYTSERYNHQLLLIQNGKAEILPFNEGGYYQFFKTDKEHYVLVPGESYFSPVKLHRINNTGTTLVTDKADGNCKTYKDRLYFTKRFSNPEATTYDTYDGLYYTDASGDIKTVTNLRIAIFNIVGDWLLYNNEVYYLPTNQNYRTKYKDLPRSLAIQNGFESEGAVVFSYYDSNYIVILKKDDWKKIKVDNLVDIRPVSGGFIFTEYTDGGRKLYYYNLLNNEQYRIDNDQNDNTMNLQSTNTSQTIVLFNTYDNYNLNNLYHWSPAQKKAIRIENAQGSEISVGNNGVLLQNRQKPNGVYTYYHFNGDELIEKYDIQLGYYNYSFSFFSTNYSPQTGNEVVQLGVDSLVHYPEIVKGSEGIEEMQGAFFFNGNLYIQAFTYTHGYQIWKMGEAKKETNLLLAEENEEEDSIKVYPNPTENTLFVESEIPYQFKVVNLQGQVLRSGTTEQKSIDFTQFSTGLYLLQFYDGKKTFQKKIMKR